MNNNTQCDLECYTDADCRGDNKCCPNGCGQVCVSPESYDRPPAYVPSTPASPPFYPDVPQVPQVPAAVFLEEKTQEELNVVQPEGDVATLRCYATGYPLPTVSWKRDSVVVCYSTFGSVAISTMKKYVFLLLDQHKSRPVRFDIEW